MMTVSMIILENNSLGLTAILYKRNVGRYRAILEHLIESIGSYLSLRVHCMCSYTASMCDHAIVIKIVIPLSHSTVSLCLLMLYLSLSYIVKVPLKGICPIKLS